MTADEVKARGYNLDIKNPHTVEKNHDPPPNPRQTQRKREGKGGRAKAEEGSGRDGPSRSAEPRVQHVFFKPTDLTKEAFTLSPVKRSFGG